MSVTFCATISKEGFFAKDILPMTCETETVALAVLK